MSKLTNIEREERKKIAEAYEKKQTTQRMQAYKKLPEQVRLYLKNLSYYYGNESDTELTTKLKEGLADGTYKKPSDFVKKELSSIFGTVVPKEMKPSLLYEVDHCIDYPYTMGWLRRPFRSAGYLSYITKINNIIKSYETSVLPLTFEQIVSGNMTDEQRAYFEQSPNARNEYDIAYCIDAGCENTIAYIKELLEGGLADVLSYDIFRAIFMGNNKGLYELAGKLLIAAKLQEGLRQAICETCDEGRFEAFRYMLHIITEQNFLRYSSVKRAIGTWTGLAAFDTKDLDRISTKTLELMNGCLDNEAFRKECLSSDDAMKIHISLWSLAVTDVENCISHINEICENGTHPQLMAAAYFTRELISGNYQNIAYRHRIAKTLVKTHNQSLDLMALIVGFLFRNTTGNNWKTFDAKKELKNFFENKKEAETIYEKLMEIYQNIPKKELTYSPCVFPWNTESLTKSDVVKKLIYLAAVLGDNDKIDEMCQHLSEIDVGGYGSRSYELHLLLEHPKTDIQLDMLVAELADKESSTRKSAYDIVKQTKLEARHYLQLEAMLRYKAADIRSNVIELLMNMEDDDLYECAKRLVSEKKEEKRTAGLDIIMQLGKDDNRKECYESCLPLAQLIKKPTTKEQILIDQLHPAKEKAAQSAYGYGLYTGEDSYAPKVDEAFMEECFAVFEKYFPNTTYVRNQSSNGKKSIFKKGKGAKKSKNKDTSQHEILKALDDLIEEHKNDEYKNAWGEMVLLGNDRYVAMEEMLPDGTRQIPFTSLWDEFYETHIKSPMMLLRMKLATSRRGILKPWHDFIIQLFGEEFDCESTLAPLVHRSQVGSVLNYLSKHENRMELVKIDLAVKMNLMDAVQNGLDMYVEVERSKSYYRPTHYYWKGKELVKTQDDVRALYSETMIVTAMSGSLGYQYAETFPTWFALGWMLSDLSGMRKFRERMRSDSGSGRGNASGVIRINGVEEKVSGGNIVAYAGPTPTHYIRAAYEGLISKGYLYRHFFEEVYSRSDVFSKLCGIVQRYHDSERMRLTRRYFGGYRAAGALGELLCMDKPEITDENRGLVEFAAGIYEDMMNIVLDSELKRGDSPEEFSEDISSIGRIYGVDRFVQILAALGKDTLDRVTYHYGAKNSKRNSLSRLLGVCVPRESDDAAKLGELIKKTDISEKRLVEAALYSPEWIGMVEEYLGWKGFRSACYYFMAHMNDQFDDVRQALIAKYTPISTEELAAGAFDVNWFLEAYETVGAKRFDMIYDAAKYISDGAKHSRARKYADAALGKLDAKEVAAQIKEKRNKDTLMAYALLPLPKERKTKSKTRKSSAREDEIFARYLLFQQFKKESKQFGAQRRASEGAAVDMAMRNLATNAGYSDVTRLTLRMETKLFDDIRPLTEPNVTGEITIQLVIDEQGKVSIACEKGGKALKSVPSKYNKDELVVRMKDVKKQLTEQYRRTRVMLEQAMEDRVAFKASEIEALGENPVVYPLVRDLVFLCDERSGFFKDGKLVSVDGSAIELLPDSDLIVAHPFDLYTQGSWRDYQKSLFDRKVVQPFKQIFRELYVKTDEERDAFNSMRYSGNQIQPKQTIGCLRGRRWVADIEDGLQKIYYKENIIARIYALADWFSPADIEAPTLEWVEFFDRKTGKVLCIKDIPDIIFSEVMRDVDLAVSVAHAGGVDPETSHSTIEMRRAICEFTMPLFKLTNVTFEKSHAFIKGERADYSIHLGSGVVHLQGGPMINVLPVHSQHRGKLFLPFADEDPKTAQIISEILLFAEDRKIKDPFILGQIK